MARSTSMFSNRNSSLPKWVTNPRPMLCALLMLALIVGFDQLHIRMQGRIVETITFGAWPFEWAMRKHFRDNEIGLGTIKDFVRGRPEITRLDYRSDVSGRQELPQLKAAVEGETIARRDLDQSNVLQALISLEAQFVDVADDRVNVVLGTEERGATTFNAAFVFPFERIEMPSCDDISRWSRPKIGACGFNLRGSWLIVYQWQPAALDDLEKAIKELEENSGSP